jgi:hypothetical protein
MLDFYEIKYQHSNKLIALRAINYFDDIDPSIDPPVLKKSISIAKIQKRIQEATLHGNKKF